MPWAGGSFTRLNGDTGWVDDASLGIGIEAGEHDLVDTDFKNGINQCLNKDGSNSCTGDLNLGNNKIVNSAAGTAAAPAICLNNDVNTGIFGPAADTVAIATNGSERLRIDSSGNCGVGETTPTARLHAKGTGVVELVQQTASSLSNGVYTLDVNSSSHNSNLSAAGAFRIQIDGNTQALVVAGNGTTAIGGSVESSRFTVISSNSSTPIRTRTPTGDVAQAGIDVIKFDTTNTSAQKFINFFVNNGNTASGAVVANGAAAATFGTVSDERLKDNIQDLPSQLNNILSLRPVEFDYKDGSGHQIGFIAQEVQPIFPDVVSEEGGYLMLAGMSKNDARLIKAFQELAAKVKALEARIAELEA